MSEMQIPKGQYCELNTADILLPENSNPRDTEPQGHLFGLKDSFETIGQLEAVIVSKTDDKYYAIAGRRRIEAAKLAGQTTIEAKVYENIDRRTLLLMIAAENIHRKAFTVIEEARLIRMFEEEKFHLKVIAAKLGQSVDTVRRKRNLLDLPDDVQKMIVRDKDPLPVHQATMLHGLSISQQLEAAREIAPITGPVANEKEAKEIIDELKGPKLDLSGKKKSRRSASGEKHKENIPTKEQKKAVPKILKLGKTNKKLTPEFEINICGRTGIAPPRSSGEPYTLKFSDASVILTFGKKEIPLQETLEINLFPPSPILRHILNAAKIQAEAKNKKGEK